MLAQYLLAVPQRVGPSAPRCGWLRHASRGWAPRSHWWGLTVRVIMCRGVLVLGALASAQEIGPASLGLLVFGAWVVVAAVVGQRAAAGAPCRSRPRVRDFHRALRGLPSLGVYRVGRWMPTIASSREVSPARPSTHPDSTCPRDRRRCLSCRHPGAVVKRPSQSVVAGMPLAGTRARSTRRLVAASRWSRRLGTGRHRRDGGA